jgi:hypothetical protein
MRSVAGKLTGREIDKLAAFYQTSLRYYRRPESASARSAPSAGPDDCAKPNDRT